METTERSTVVGAFEHRRDAEKAVEELHRAGFHDDQIGFAARDGEAMEAGTTIEETGSHAGSGAAGGLVTGGVIGGILGALAAGLIPGIGPVLAGGILAGVLGGAAVGAAAGGLLGGLMGMGVPEEEAHHYNKEFESGRTIVTVQADGRYDEARAILQRYGVLEYAGQPAAAMMTDTPSQPRYPARPAQTADDSRTMQLREEKLRTSTEPVQTGQVELRKEVVSEQKTMDVPVTREEVVVERRSVDSRPADRPIGAGETIEIPVHEERVEVDKRAVVYEEVELGKRQVHDTERVTETVRREEAHVEHDGDVNVRDTGMGASAARSWDEVGPAQRQEWERRPANSGRRWDEVEPYHHYGYEMAADSRYRDRDWNAVESDLHSDYPDWARRHNYPQDESTWDRFKDTIREAWDNARSKTHTR